MIKHRFPVTRWTVRVGRNHHCLLYFSGTNTADLFVHAPDSTIIRSHQDVCTGMRNAANFARTIGAHLDSLDFRSLNLTARTPNLSKGRWAKR